MNRFRFRFGSPPTWPAWPARPAQPVRPARPARPAQPARPARPTAAAVFVVAAVAAILKAPNAHALKIQDVTFPSYAMLGQTVTLICEYALGEAEYVDSIKWYKDGEEFYRIVPNTPREQDRVVVFHRTGIKLDRQNTGLLKTGMHQLVLQDVTLGTSGRYMCQITESKPPFHTEQREKNLTVIIRPESGPEILGLRDEYVVEDTIDVLCSSARSYPAASLDFFINDEPVGEHMKTRYPVKASPDGLLQSSTLGLKYPIRSRSFSSAHDELSLKCTAKIGNAYWQSVVHKARIKRLGIPLESRSAASNSQKTGWWPLLALLAAACLPCLPCLPACLQKA